MNTNIVQTNAWAFPRYWKSRRVHIIMDTEISPKNQCIRINVLLMTAFNESFYRKLLLHCGSEKNLLTDGMTSGGLLRTNLRRPCCAYFSPSAKLSRMPAALFSLVTLTSGLVVIFRISCIPQMLTAVPTTRKIG